MHSVLLVVPPTFIALLATPAQGTLFRGGLVFFAAYFTTLIAAVVCMTAAYVLQHLARCIFWR